MTGSTGSDLKFVPFYEYNDQEGESWVFWLQLNGNQDALGELDSMLAAMDGEYYEYPYSIDTEIIEPEFIVDKLVEHGGGGYRDYQNKVVGTLVFPETFVIADDDGNDDLYKGGIEDLFQ